VEDLKKGHAKKPFPEGETMPKSNRTKRKVKNRSKARRAQVKRKRARHNKTTRRGMRGK
jgi:hypothetical protein